MNLVIHATFNEVESKQCIFFILVDPPYGYQIIHMITIFFQKKETVFFFITRLFYLVQIAAETSSNLFSMVFWNCIKIV